ncbi:MFS transporter [Burkholderia ambifaria]|uniref:Major facilitator superfamily MFS_1 n=1 Tax=Burkholderia ambifaria MEX-5 TaxID=396597 RepID=B1SXT4_9BURK|nr:MFS transporter [Burkholderia ambifaria]EDT43843.1 major facilitator superfamily MFS_1 [Burkholderia ambifaria MEX-5]
MNLSETRSVPISPIVSDMATEAVYTKINRRIVPILILAYVIAFLDRTNIGYAQLQMKQTLPWSEAVYGVGAGIFFVGYLLFEIPSNLMLEKIGVRRTLLRIMVMWGLTASAMMFVTTPTEFYIARFMLGVFEAGFFPGTILYFTYWYPSHRRGKVFAYFMASTVISGIVAGPLCGAILKYFDGVSGMYGWQWLYLMQGMPAAVIGILVFMVLADKPDDATWLTDAEKRIVRESLARDDKYIGNERHATFWMMVGDFRVWMLTLVYALILAGSYTLLFWMPTLVHSWNVKDVLLVGILAAIPNAVGAAGMVMISSSSDQRRERRWHYVGAIAIACLGLLTTAALKGSVTSSVISLSVSLFGIASLSPLVMAISSEYLSARSAAVGIAFISGFGNIGPAVSPSINAVIIERTHDPAYSLFFIVSVYLLSALVLMIAVRRSHRQQRAG